MKRPTEVQIGFSRWRIRWLSEKAWTKRTRLDTMGLTQIHRHEIWIQVADEVSEALIAEVLLHEVLHAAWSAGCLEQLGNRARPKDREELLVASLSPILLGVLKDNPGLVEYLTATH